MGSSETEVGRFEDEEPQHQVSITTFFIGKFPITQSQWQAIMKSEPSHFKDDNLPVEQVSWYDAVKFCRFLSEKTGKEYRLPSEAEWEYAARAKTETPFGFGYTITPEQVNYDGNYPYLFMNKGTYRAKTTVVGSLGFANGFGLYDMHGNVYEWCQDIYHTTYKGIPTNGHAWESGGDANYRVIRGGSWSSDAVFCRSASRARKKADLTSNNVGFRIVCSLRS
jgi:formylglycine-generating enzyme required for sulfatase activity